MCTTQIIFFWDICGSLKDIQVGCKNGSIMKTSSFKEYDNKYLTPDSDDRIQHVIPHEFSETVITYLKRNTPAQS